MPAAYENNVFMSCEGDLQDEVGTYTSDGQSELALGISYTGGPLTAAYTWSQPATLPASSTLPWTPRIPASSNCVTYQSTDLFSAAATTAASSGSASGSGATSGSTSRETSGSHSSKTSAGTAVNAASASATSKKSSAARQSAFGRGWTWAVLAVALACFL